LGKREKSDGPANSLPVVFGRKATEGKLLFYDEPGRETDSMTVLHSAPAKPVRASSGGLKRSKPGVNENGGRYREVLDGVLYVDRRQFADFKRRLKALCKEFDYRFVPFDLLYEVEEGQMKHRESVLRGKKKR